MEDWSENELDSLWIVVRRDGKGNWEAQYQQIRPSHS